MSGHTPGCRIRTFLSSRAFDRRRQPRVCRVGLLHTIQEPLNMPTLVLPFQLPCHLRLRSRATARLASPSAALGTPRALRGGREAWRCFSELHGGAPCLPVHRSASTNAAGRIGRGRAAHSACAPRSLSCCCVRVRLRKRCARAKARDVLRAARGKRSALQSPRHRHGTRVPRSGKHLGSRLRGHFTRRGRRRKAEGGRAEPARAAD